MYTELIYMIYKLTQERRVPTKELLISLGITEDKIKGALEENIIIEKFIKNAQKCLTVGRFSFIIIR